MRQLDKLYFLIHGLCYADMKFNSHSRKFEVNFGKYLERENQCADKRRARLKKFLPDECLVIVPWPAKNKGPVNEFNKLAVSILGDRCFILDCNYKFDPELLYKGRNNFHQAVLEEFKPIFARRETACNKEELGTAFHSLACCRYFEGLLREREYSFDRKKVLAEGWGASFEGCVTKYTLNIRKLLNLTNVIEIDYSMTVPDAFFLLKAKKDESILLDNGIRLFLFDMADSTIALYTFTAHSPVDRAACVKLQFEQDNVTIKSKQGIRLWPKPEAYILQNVPAGYQEPSQEKVKFDGNRLHVPINAGFVYRLAKAPAYVFAQPNMKRAKFRDILMSAEL